MTGSLKFRYLASNNTLTIFCLPFIIIKFNENIIYYADEPGIHVFSVNANVNDDIQVNQVGTLSDSVYSPKNNQWSIEKKLIHQFHKEDAINYWIYVQFNDTGYTRKEQWRIGGSKLWIIILVSYTFHSIKYSSFFFSVWKNGWRNW